MREPVIRPYDDSDEEGVLQLLAASLGKVVDDRYRGFFRWKHLQNPFGRSFMWVAEVDGRLAGFRAFMRWRFLDPGAEPVEAVRAVDTATHPDFQGMGIFSKLTLHGLDEMRPQGIDFVFNTPNAKSRPGYLKMGWTIDQRIAIQVRPRSPISMYRMVRSKTAADPWSAPTDVGEPQLTGLGSACEADPRPGALVTERSRQFIAWRYFGFPAVASVSLAAGGGLVLARFRRRGPALECAIEDVLGEVGPRDRHQAVLRALAGGRADYALASADPPIRGMVTVPNLGPIQTRRLLTDAAIRLPLALSLGDTELL